MANSFHCHGAEGENHGLRLVFAREVRDQLASYIDSGNRELAKSELLRLTNDHSLVEPNIKAWLLWKELIRLLHIHSTQIVHGRLQILYGSMTDILGDNDNFEHGFWMAVAEVEGLRERVSTDSMDNLRLAHFDHPLSDVQKGEFVDLAERVFRPMTCAGYRSTSGDQGCETSTRANHCEIKANISRAMNFGYPAHYTFKNEMEAKRIDMEVEIITDMCPLMVERDDPADPADHVDDNHDIEEGGAAAAAAAGADGAVGGVNESPPIPVSEDQREKDDGSSRPDQPPALAGERIMVAICVVNQSQPEQDMMPFRTTVRLLNADGTVMGDHEFYGYRQHDQHNVNVRVYIPRQLAQDNINGNQGKINVSIDLISIINEVDDGYG